MENKKIYITTPIFYVNDAPHIGHCYTMVVADALARIYLLKGCEVRVQTGTDEHGQKIEQSALDKRTKPMLLANEMSRKFYELAVQINFCASYPSKVEEGFDQHATCMQLLKDDSPTLFNNGANFIRTSEGRDFATGKITPKSLEGGRHVKAVQEFWTKLEKNGWIYKGKYSGWYAVRDEAFYDESELIEGKAPSGAPVEWREEESYFFKLSKFQQVLLRLYNNNEIIKPNEKTAEILAFISGLTSSEASSGNFKDGSLRDLSISRKNLTWGIPVPLDLSHTVYVWLDALVNYYSAIGYPSGRKQWEEDFVIHIVGKDILRFHAVYWPAFLIGENFTEEELHNVADKQILKVIPKQILTHGWWTNKGEKISKSLGNAVKPLVEIEAIERSFETDFFQAVDYFRYILLTTMPIGNDGSYDLERATAIINSGLCNNVGNLINRVLSLICKNCTAKEFFDEGTFPQIPNPIINMAEEFEFSKIISSILEFSSIENKQIEENKPWEMVKNGKKEHFLPFMQQRYVNMIRITMDLRPFIPNTATRILSYINHELKQVFSTKSTIPIFFRKSQKIN